MSEEFTAFGMTIPRIAILNGAILTAWGVISYFMQSADPPSITALIPAFMGFPMLTLGLLSEKNAKNRHHYMHASMALALVMTIGGARIVTGYSDNSPSVSIGKPMNAGIRAVIDGGSALCMK
jgi:hypothetical protein